MDNFYQILDLLFKANKKYPVILFGELMENLYLRGNEKFCEFSNEEIVNRLKELLKDE